MNRLTWKKCFCFAILGLVILLIYLLCNTVNKGRLRLNNPKWEDPGPYHVAFPHNYQFIMDITPVCKTTTPFLVLMVHVGPGDVAARDTIRKTWGNEKKVLGQLVSTVFIVGLAEGPDADHQQEKLREESYQHHDLIQSDFLDTSYNSTIKTMVMMRWLVAHCSEASYVMKVDPDVFVHVHNLVQLLLDPGTAKQNYMTGLVIRHRPVLRNPYLKLYMPREVIPEPEYPAYPMNMAYIMSLDLAEKILSVPSRIKPIHITDVYLGMCLKDLDISLSDPTKPTMFLMEPIYQLSNCRLLEVIAARTMGISLMTSLWERSRDQDTRC